LKKDFKIHLAFILECIELIENYMKGVAWEEFLSSSQLQDAVIRRIELIGEAARNIPEEIRNQGPEIPWSRVIGMRNILIHDYLGIDLRKTWSVAANEIPGLKKQIASLKRELEK
jgi:uncharacterized protein with HEPN domain